MNASNHRGQTNTTGFLIVLLVVTLLAGAVLIRLVDDDAQPIVGTATGPTGSTTGDTLPEEPRKGSLAPNFTLQDLKGRPVSLSDWRGQPVLINFWATWCAPCELEMPDIQSAYQAHQAEGFVVLAIAVADEADDVQRFFKKHDLTFHALMDDGAVSAAYEVFGLPTSFFVGADGRIVAVHSGVLTKSKIESYLAQAQ